MVLVNSHHSHSIVSVTAGRCCQRNTCEKATVHYLLSRQQTDTVRQHLVNIVEHLAAKELDITLRSWWRPKTELEESEYWTKIN